jgi:hypothetical protein
MHRFTFLAALSTLACSTSGDPDGGTPDDAGRVVFDAGADSGTGGEEDGGSEEEDAGGAEGDAGVDAGPACEEDTARCEASILSVCTAGVWRSFDCAGIGLACVTDATGSGCGDAVCWDGERRCEAGTLLTCAGRRWSRVEPCAEGVCRTFGPLAVCGPASDAVTATPLFEYGPLEVVEWAAGTSGLELDFRTVYTYDAMKRVEQTVRSGYVSGAWIELERTTYTYGAYGIATTEIELMIDGVWTRRERWTRGYDSAGRLIASAQQRYDTAGVLQPSTYRHEYEYDAGGFHLERVRALEDGTWRGQWFRIYTFDDPVLHMAFSNYSRDNDVDRYLDATGKLAFIHYRWSATISEGDYAIYAYDADGYVSSIVEYAVDTHTADHRWTLARGTDGRLARRESEGFFEGAWAPSRRVDVTHTDLGSSRTFEMDPVPVRSWATDLYGSGAVVP